MKRQIIPIIIALTVLLSACQSQHPQDSLIGSAWSLSQLNGHSLLTGSHIEMEFDRDTLSGYGGCNFYGGQYQVSRDRFILIEGVDSTAMGCLTPEGVGDQESEYFRALIEADRYMLVGNRLELLDSNGDILLVFIHQGSEPFIALHSLSNQRWRVATISSLTLIEGSLITLELTSQGHVEGFGSCRSYLAEYIEDRQGIRFTRMEMGEELCSHPDLLEQEQNFTDLLTYSDHFELIGENLVLITQRGEEVVFVSMQE